MTPDSPDRSTRIARLAVTAALAALGIWVAFGFLPALAWAVVIAIAIDPIFLRLRGARWLRGRHALAAALLTILIALIVLVPLTLGIAQAVHEAHGLLIWMARARGQGIPVPPWVQTLPFGRDQLTGWWQTNLATPEGAEHQFRAIHGTAWLAHSRLIGTTVLHRFVILAFTLVTLFFLLRDRDALLAQARLVSDRLLGPTGERIGVQAVLSVRGTIDGLVLVGIGEGVLMIVPYMFLGVPHPILFGAVTCVAAMIPFCASFVFAIAALLLLVQGSAVAAAAVVAIGLLVINIADHFIRPALIGGATRLPFLWVLIGILGGVEALGLLGLFIGPATMAVLVMLWRDYVAGASSGGRAEPS